MPGLITEEYSIVLGKVMINLDILRYLNITDKDRQKHDKLVGGLGNFIFPYIGNVIILIDVHIYQKW